LDLKNIIKMSQDIIADTLNMMINALKAGKDHVLTKRYSKFLISVLAIAKLKGYVKDYKTEDEILRIDLGKLNGCSSVKPRFFVKIEDFDKFKSRFLPAKNIGVLVVSTSQGLMTHQTAIENNIGGSLIAYFY
jgi:small subunit ribosomal protein S8